MWVGAFLWKEFVGERKENSSGSNKPAQARRWRAFLSSVSESLSLSLSLSLLCLLSLSSVRVCVCRGCGSNPSSSIA